MELAALVAVMGIVVNVGQFITMVILIWWLYRAVSSIRELQTSLELERQARGKSQGVSSN